SRNRSVTTLSQHARWIKRFTSTSKNIKSTVSTII
ncbi:glucose-6-phosphate dehydrogenase, C-terminal domain protein, partial [Vibrio parahaemolyticus V-223/04]